ncbi:MAG: YIP1 family protein, partial [Acholeplasma sp.]|nr:YIP1 family protein [Acholeplasma sp.]
TYNEAINQYEVTNTYKKPTNTPYFEESDVFEPTKIITDHANLVYIVLANNFNGLAKYNDKGEFTGYFGGNQLPKTFENMIKSLLFDEQQRREWFKMIPNPVYNVGVDHSGLIVTTTKLEYGYKKINIANQVYNESLWGFDDIEDVFVGPNHTIFTISKEGMIVEYSPEGEVLFIFSGKDDFSQKGLFKNPTGIAVDSKNNLYAIDSQAKSLQIFIPTEFADTIHEAITLYYDGRYSESLEPWQKVLKMNALFDLANKGIGDAYFAQMEYEKAMESYVVARETEGYSQAFWEVRNKKLLDNGTTIVIIIFSLVLLVLANQFLKFGKYLKKPFVMLHKFLKKFKLYNELLFGFYVIKKPSDAFYGIKREKKGSNLAAIIYYLLFFIVYMIWLYNTNFIFNDVVKSEIVVFTEIIKVFLPILLWVFSNYLIGNIRDGEGKMSDIFQGTAYILLPAIITLPILTFISHYLTFNEAFIYNIFAYIGIGLSAIYLVIMVKEIHFYDMKPTIANIFITIFTAIILVVFTLIVYLLLNEIIGLVLDIIREVSNRV